MNPPDFRPGFRISADDAVILTAGAACSAVLYGMNDLLSMIILFTLANFFLFCNVLRMNRVLELIWTALYIPLAAGSIHADVPAWPCTCAIMTAVTAALAAVQLRQPSYHGIFWRKINPDLPKWHANRAARHRPFSS
jgi:hypothetical protein